MSVEAKANNAGRGKGNHKTIPLPPIDLVRRLLCYDQETGVFTWNKREAGENASRNERRSVSTFNSVFAGKQAGCKDQNGYLLIGICGVVYKAHRLAMYMATGEQIPFGFDVDHINGIRDDNRFSNIRIATRSQNNQNMRGPKNNNKVGVRGVFRHQGKFRARIQKNGIVVEIGMFESKELAASAVVNAMRTHFGEFSNSDVCR